MGVLPPAGCGYVLRDLLAPLLSASNGYAAFAPGDPFSMQPLVCVDPVDQSNNMAKACYRVGLVQRLFAEAATAALATAERLAAATKPATKPGATTLRAAEASLPRVGTGQAAEGEEEAEAAHGAIVGRRPLATPACSLLPAPCSLLPTSAAAGAAGQALAEGPGARGHEAIIQALMEAGSSRDARPPRPASAPGP